jgi:hypothetical protein
VPRKTAIPVLKFSSSQRIDGETPPEIAVIDALEGV